MNLELKNKFAFNKVLAKWLLYFIVIETFVIAIIRSWYLDVTNDEAYSIMLVDTLNFKMMIGTANTHWLNSFFIFFENLFLGHAEWALRLHSSIAIIFFTYFLIKIFKPNFSDWLILIPISLLPLNNYLIDFFSQCRGYGLAITFEMVAFYYIIHESKEKKFLIYLFLSLATLSNFTCIYILYSYFLLDIIELIRSKNWQAIFSVNFLKSTVPLFLVSMFSIPIIFYIKYYTGDLEEGLNNGFFQDTLATFFNTSYELVSLQMFKYISMILVVCTVVFYIINFSKIATGHKRMFEMLFVNIILIYFLFGILHVPFPYGRTSLFFIIPFIVVLSYMMLFYIEKLYFSIHPLIGLVFFVLNFWYVFQFRNMHVTKEWWMQQGLSEYFSDFKKMNLTQVKQLKLGMSIDHYGSFDNYYRHFDKQSYPDSIFVYSRKLYANMDSNAQSQFAKQDYLLMINDYKTFLERKISPQNQTLIKHYKHMNTDFIEVKH